MLDKILDAKPYIIAEVGSNWHDFGDVSESISVAAKCGANAVKFQLLSQMELYGTEGDRFARLDESWLPQMKEKADACGVDFMCTAFSVEGYKKVDPFVKAHKIASGDFNNLPLVRFVASLGKPIILSCGGSCFQDIRMVTAELTAKNAQFVLLYCNSAYPSFEHDLAFIPVLRDFAKYVGYSDHSLDVINAPKVAFQQFDAVVIEKHFALDRLEGTDDLPHSLDQAEFKKMCVAIRATGDSAFGSAEEDTFRVRDSRKAKAITVIQQGDVLKHGVNYQFYRSATFEAGAVGGFSPSLVDAVQGKPVRRSFVPGDAVNIGDVVL